MSAGKGSVERVAYLIGAGASHGSVAAIGGDLGILMRDLSPLIDQEIHKLLSTTYAGVEAIGDLANAVINEETDFEHVITFLDESPSALHRNFANDLRRAFEKVLRERLNQIEAQHGAARVRLYVQLLDMYEVKGFPEELAGILTLNYDNFIELAIQGVIGGGVDFGIELGDPVPPDSIKLLKLHGSFDWTNAWPVRRGSTGDPLWIPPGIQKAKDRYPFNLLWGRAREVLDCDVLRIVGCNLGPNDWDLISLIFTTRHAGSTHQPYRIEVIDSPSSVANLSKRHPYLDVRSILEVDPVGRSLVGEFLGGEPRSYGELKEAEREVLMSNVGSGKNWFRIWLQQMAEAIFEEYGSVETKVGAFKQLLESA